MRHAVGVHGYRPVHQVQINVRRFQHVQALLQTLFGARVECAPELAGDEEVFSLDNASRDDILEGVSHLVLVLVAEGAVNVPVAALNGMHNSLLDFTWRRLPRSQAKGGDSSASVQGNSGVHVGLRIDDALWCTLEHKLGKGGIHRDLAGVVGVYVAVGPAGWSTRTELL